MTRSNLFPQPSAGRALGSGWASAKALSWASQACHGHPCQSLLKAPSLPGLGPGSSTGSWPDCWAGLGGAEHGGSGPVPKQAASPVAGGPARRWVGPWLCREPADGPCGLYLTGPTHWDLSPARGSELGPQLPLCPARASRRCTMVLGWVGLWGVELPSAGQGADGAKGRRGSVWAVWLDGG